MNKNTEQAATGRDMGWHVEIIETEFVRWGYGPGTFENGMHCDRACVVVDLGGIVTDFPFELPEHRPGSSLGKPQEYGRRRMVGWRLRNNRFTVDTGWELTDTVEHAKEQAAACVRAKYASAPRSNEVLLTALEDVRVLVEVLP